MTETVDRSSARASSNVKTRLASALVLVPIVLGAEWYGDGVFAALVLIAGLIMAWEWTRMIGGAARSDVMLGLYWLAVVGSCAGAYFGFVTETLVAITVIGVIAFLVAPERGRRTRGLFFFGVPYVGLPLVAFIVLRNDPDWGLWCVLLLLVIIWATDTAAFFAGRAIGGPKLAPSVSPKKTWSGALAGLLAAFVAGTAMAWSLGLENMIAVGLAAGVLSVFGQAGDLLESGVKRRFGVKDSSSIIPGHGGILDRLDSLVIAGPAAWIIGAMRAGHEHAASGILIW